MRRACVGPVVLSPVPCSMAGSRSQVIAAVRSTVLQVGDSCELGQPNTSCHSVSVVKPWRPVFGEATETGHLWTVYMLQGPQAAPDYFTEADMEVRVYSTVVLSDHFILLICDHPSHLGCDAHQTKCGRRHSLLLTAWCSR